MQKTSAILSPASARMPKHLYSSSTPAIFWKCGERENSLRMRVNLLASDPTDQEVINKHFEMGASNKRQQNHLYINKKLILSRE